MLQKIWGLSKKGKEILIKSALQSVSTYANECFQLTKGQCSQLSLVSSKFLWGDANDKKKVHWIGWDRIECAKARKWVAWDSTTFMISIKPYLLSKPEG
jgi:hypothetical protein